MLRVAICDDCGKEREDVRKIIEEFMNFHTIPCAISEFESGKMLLQTNLDFQLVFLDIMMDEKNGIAVGNEIFRRNRRAKIIFQTSYREFCKDAVNISHAFAFLEKPLKKEEVRMQLEAFMSEDMELLEPSMEFSNVIWVHNGIKEEKAAVSLPIQDIMYFSYLKTMKRVEIVTAESEYICKAAMHTIEEKMKPFHFAVSCRGILVNLENVNKIQGYQVFLKNGECVTLSQKRVQEFKMELGNCIQNSMYRR